MDYLSLAHPNADDEKLTKLAEKVKELCRGKEIRVVLKKPNAVICATADQFLLMKSSEPNRFKKIEVKKARTVRAVLTDVQVDFDKQSLQLSDKSFCGE